MPEINHPPSYTKCYPVFHLVLFLPINNTCLIKIDNQFDCFTLKIMQSSIECLLGDKKQDKTLLPLNSKGDAELESNRKRQGGIKQEDAKCEQNTFVQRKKLFAQSFDLVFLLVVCFPLYYTNNQYEIKANEVIYG